MKLLLYIEFAAVEATLFLLLLGLAVAAAAVVRCRHNVAGVAAAAAFAPIKYAKMM